MKHYFAGVALIYKEYFTSQPLPTRSTVAVKELILLLAVLIPAALSAQSAAPANPLWHEQKTRNYLPHMSWPDEAAVKFIEKWKQLRPMTK